MPEHRTAEDLAWASGLFEGEGCLHVSQRKNGKWNVQARLASTDRDVVDRFAEIMQVGRIRDHHPAAHQAKGWKRQFEWYTQAGPDVVTAIDLLLPRLGTRRTRKALEVREVAAALQPHSRSRTHCPKGHELTPDNLDTNSLLKEGKRRCKTCRNEQARNRARARLGISPDRYRV